MEEERQEKKKSDQALREHIYLKAFQLMVKVAEKYLKLS